MNLIESIEQFFSKYQDAFEKENLVLLRSDGIVLYSIINNGNLNSQAIGALSSGLWQAAVGLFQFNKADDILNFRLSFDTTSSGVFILPLKLQDMELYLCSIYEELINPALFKRNLKVLVENFKKEFKNNLTLTPKREEFLFKDITDSEIDSLFNYN